MKGLSGPRALNAEDELADFDCGEPELNSWLAEHGLQASRVGSAQTFVLLDGRRVVGYYALTTGAVEPSGATKRAKKGMPRHPIPVIVLARLGVDRRWQGRGLGKVLLRDALLRVASVSAEVGVRAVLVHAKSEAAQAFYKRYDFEPMPESEDHLLLLIKDVQKLMS